MTDVIVTFEFGLFFALLPLRQPEKWKLKKNIWRYHRLHKCTKNHNHMLYCSWDMARDTCNCFFHFGLFFALLPPNSPKNQNFKKMKKVPGDIIILHMCTKNYDWMAYGSWDMVCDRQTDRRMDGREKWHIEVGAPPYNRHETAFFHLRPNYPLNY